MDNLEYFDMIPESGDYEYLRSPEDSKAMVICLHGYSATPYEVKDLGKHLYDLGFSSYCPLLPGHGIKNSDLARREFAALTTDKLLNFVIKLIEEYKSRYPKVILHGQSMGGMIALYLASQGSVDGATITAAPLVMPWWAKILSSVMGLTNLTIKINKPPLEQGWSYDFVCTRPIRSLSRLMKLVDQNLDNIKVPLLLCYSHADPLLKWSEGAMQKVIPENAEVRWFNESGHVMLLDMEAEQVIETIGDFYLEQFS